MDLREVWTSVVQSADIDQHMAANGQAAANARLVGDMVARLALPPRSRILVPGAGTGQMLDYLEPSPLTRFEWLFTDINPAFLTVLADRARRHPALRHVVEVDDGEDPAVSGRIDGVLAVLILEHVDWRRAVASWARLGPGWIGCIIQRNESDARMLGPGRPLTPSLERFRQLAHPTLVPETALTAALLERGYGVRWRAEQPVPDDKVMVALSFERSP